MQNWLDQYIKLGWVLIDLKDPSPVFSAREGLERELSIQFGKKQSLENYHFDIQDDILHTDIQYKLSSFFQEKKYGRAIISRQLSFLQKLAGSDLLIQRKPYLRIARPTKPQDNIGYHRDTFYGGSPYEVSVLIPYVDLTAESSLSVMDGSHVLPESAFPTTQISSPDRSIIKGSQKHQLGFLYAPKVMDPSIDKQMHPVPMKIGQALIFSLSLVHGSKENTSAQTRWSTDIRVVNSLAPVDLSGRPTYYEPLVSCPVTQCAQEYFSSDTSNV